MNRSTITRTAILTLWALGAITVINAVPPVRQLVLSRP